MNEADLVRELKSGMARKAKNNRQERTARNIAKALQEKPLPLRLCGPIKALSVQQPWAGLISAGEKTVEVRSWSTKHRGPLLICSGTRVFPGYKADKSTLGLALCVVDLVDVVPFSPQQHGRASCIPVDRLGEVAGHFAWVLEKVQQIEAFPVKGQLGLFQVSPPNP